MMQAERGRRTGFLPTDGFDNMDSFASFPTSPSSSSSSTSPRSSNSIEHRVSKMDTLAGVAIKYGVEVADIRRMNGLVTDLQMFAHKSLNIPLPGRHPPSPVLSNGCSSHGAGEYSDCTPPCRPPLNGFLDSFQSFVLKPPRCKVTSAMSSLQGYYGLTPPKTNPVTDGTEMGVYRSGKTYYLEDQLVPRNSSISAPPLGGHRKSRSLVNVNGYFPENGETNVKAAGEAASDNSEVERLIRRRQKADAFPSMRTPELLLKEDSSGGFSSRTAKSLALRPKSGSRADTSANLNGGDSYVADVFAAAVRKSSSTSNLQESENGSFVWPSSMWGLKPDAIARPIFDGFPKPVTGRRNKAALD